MTAVLTVFLSTAAFMALVFLTIAATWLYKKSQIETICQIQCSSGDSEVMTLSANFVKGESYADRLAKQDLAFDMIQRRRDANHARWVKLKEDAIAEKAAGRSHARGH